MFVCILYNDPKAKIKISLGMYQKKKNKSSFLDFEGFFPVVFSPVF